MTKIDLEAEYNNRQRVPEHPQIQARWSAAGAAYRAKANAQLDISYGQGERNKFDLYRVAGNASAPLVVYIHGGYWQRGDRKDVAMVAEVFNKRGIAVALPGYSLCPAVQVADIVVELRQCVKTIYERTKVRPVVVGHSAGGHLAAAMLATDWSKVGGVPADLVPAAYAISGVFDPAPLIGTSLNQALRLTPESARAASVQHGRTPPASATFVAAVGGDESAEFIRQGLEIAAHWSRAGVKAECVIVPGANHFTIVDDLLRPESAMQARIAGLAKG